MVLNFLYFFIFDKQLSLKLGTSVPSSSYIWEFNCTKKFSMFFVVIGFLGIITITSMFSSKNKNFY
jgi:hypothetical protein